MATTIIILNDYPLMGPEETLRGVYIWVSNGTTAYMTNRGGLPLTGALLPGLNAIADELWTEAQAGGKLPTSTETAIVEAIQWYQANAGAKGDVFDKSITQLTTDITAMVNTSFPTMSAPIKTGWVRTLMSSLLDTRVNAHDRDLV